MTYPGSESTFMTYIGPHVVKITIFMYNLVYEQT